ncbi:uncharacterized protein LOC127221926 [Phodopus roborovskii]|uniref:uncharacterized protein LOC127221926 n=1 Tax=Phodopus roborovskii TaxID=109678 RepID=UPI0021E44B8A|nr:uncharacterized protein LOC127221926 [Phodopus roborovskii]
MVTIQPILLTMVLTLSSVEQSSFRNHSSPATANELLGKWNIIRWAGNIPIPEKKKVSPLPPFTLVKNIIGKLEFRMNILKPIGCIEFKTHLDEVKGHPGYFIIWSRYTIFIKFVGGKDFAIAAHAERKRGLNYMMTMLMGRNMAPNQQMLLDFEKVVLLLGLNTTGIIHPRCDASREVVHKLLAGNMPVPEKKKVSPLPPFTFIRNIIGELEFRMNIS